MKSDDAPTSPASPWAPLRRPLFRSLWIATVVANTGTWIHEVGAGWLMVTLGASPLLVSLVQAANAAPIFLLALPAGALADILDRRRYLLGCQIWSAFIALILAIAAALDGIDAHGLLFLTFLLACGGAMMMPAWAATLPELVPRDELQAAIALNSTGINVARAIGPAIAGVIVAVSGPAAAFALNALSFAGLIVVLARWRREPRRDSMPAEHFFGAMRAGLRYVREAKALQAVMLRAVTFFLFGSGLWALLPLIAKERLGGGSAAFGVLLGCMGAGAVLGALLLPRLRRRCSRNTLVRAGSVLSALGMVGLIASPRIEIAIAPMLASGFAWIAVISSLHVSAQNTVPSWVKARALAVYMVTFAAGMMIGSALWGSVASRFGLVAALLASAAGAVLGLFATWRVPLGVEPGEDDATAAIWPAPVVQAQIEPERGPVLITVEYQVQARHRDEFVALMQPLARIRRRDGAMSWGLFEDAAQLGRFVETFLVESWAEHERQHARATVADQAVMARPRALHVGAAPPRVSHLVASRLER